MLKYLLYTVVFIYVNSAFSQDVFEDCRKGNLTHLKQLVQLKKDTINSKNEYGFSPLIIAVYRDQKEIVQYLLEQGANVDFISGEGSALMAACYKSNEEFVKLLLKKGANPNLQNEIGTTALMYAVMNQNKLIIKLLLDNKADITIKEKSGRSVFDFIPQPADSEILKLLEKK